MTVNYSQWQPSPTPGCAELLPCPPALALSPSAADLHMNSTAYADRALRSNSHESQMTQPSPVEMPFASLFEQHVLLK